MKAVIITDQHLGARGDSPLFLDFMEKFYKECFFPFIDDNNINTVINLGDTFDRRKFINFSTLHRSKKMYFDELQKRKIYSPTIIGNHDTFHKNTNKTNSIDLVVKEYHYENIRPIIHEPEIISFEGVDVALVPWICADNKQICLDFLKTCKTDLLLGHFPINGFVIHKGQIEENGFDKELFDKFDMVLSGHFHHRSSNGRIYYLGNPYEITWQDYGDLKGFHVFDFNTRKLEFVPNPFKMFHKIEYNDIINSHIIQNNLEIYTNTYVKVVVDKKTNQDVFNSFMNSLYNVNPFSINIVENFQEVIEVELDLNQSDDTITLCEQYIENMNSNGILTDYNPKKLKAFLAEAYQQCLSE